MKRGKIIIVTILTKSVCVLAIYANCMLMLLSCVPGTYCYLSILWVYTERLQQERQQALEKMGISVQASGIKVEKNKYYLVNLNADPSLNELLVYYLKVINSFSNFISWNLRIPCLSRNASSLITYDFSKGHVVKHKTLRLMCPNSMRVTYGIFHPNETVGNICFVDRN